MRHFPSLSLDQVYATLLYDGQNRAHIDAYSAAHVEDSKRVRREFWKDQPEIAVRLRKLRQEEDRKKRSSRAAGM